MKKTGKHKENRKMGQQDSLVPRTTSFQKQYHQWSQVLTKNSNLTTLQLGKCGIAQVSQRLTVFLIELIEDSCTSIQGLPTLLAEDETVHADCIALLQASLYELAIETANIENILYCF